MQDLVRAEVPKATVPQGTQPKLLVQWSSGRRDFFENLRDLLHFREARQPRLTAQRAEFWPDVFVHRPVAWRSMASSALYHIFGIVVIYGMSVTWLQPAPVSTRSPFDKSQITYYKVSEYLPEINTGEDPAPSKREQKGEPKFATQRIISIPRAPDNFRQTIVTPSQIKLPRDVAMPNLVAWTPIPSAVPEAALAQTPSQLKLPAMMPEVISPSPSTEALRAKSAAPIPAEAVAPPPAIDLVKSKLPNLPEPSVIEPAPSTTGQQLGTMNVARLETTVAAPKMPVQEQRVATAGSAWSGAGGGGAQNATPPAPPNVTGIGNGKQAVGRVIALGLDPAAVNGPIKIPNGSRSGQFAATPEGSPNAAGTPDIKGGNINGAGGSGRVANGGGSGAGSGPTGISVGPAPSRATAGIAGTPADAGKIVPKQTTIASLERSREAELSRRLSRANLDAPGKIEDKVFGARRYYSMALNMPNLTSAGGSWIIRFAELQETVAQGDIVAPQVVLKVDPSYPGELMRDRVEGTVTLYAVIRKDGTVSEVRVLRGLEERLDENAKTALSKWKFRPATKNGSAVDLEAVVQIPFAVKKMPF